MALLGLDIDTYQAGARPLAKAALIGLRSNLVVDWAHNQELASSATRVSGRRRPSTSSAFAGADPDRRST